MGGLTCPLRASKHPEGEPLLRSRRALTCATIIGSLTFAAPAVAHSQHSHSWRGQGNHGWGGWHGRGQTLWASPSGTGSRCSLWNPCSLQNAVATATSGATVNALPGTYDGGVVIDTSISLIGWHATINAATASTGNGIQITGPGGSGSTVKGFTVENAKFEGILVGTAPVSPSSTTGAPTTSGEPVSNVTIADNTVTDNDTGFNSDAGQCFSTPNAPGDCGEAIHLVAVTDSTVAGNDVVDNAGGILLTDEFGPTDGNLIIGNHSIDNAGDCGITLAGHNTATATAVSPVTGLPTGAAGVFDNRVIGNVSVGNGTAGQGAGILLGGGAPYAGVYGNVIRDNVATGNGLSGITIHQHFVGDLNGNVVVGNLLSNNNLDGDYDFAAAQATGTNGILVAAGLPPAPPGTFPPFLAPKPITGTVIKGNRFADSSTGIWTLGVDPTTTTIAHNWFAPSVTTPVSTN